MYFTSTKINNFFVRNQYFPSGVIKKGQCILKNKSYQVNLVTSSDPLCGMSNFILKPYTRGYESNLPVLGAKQNLNHFSNCTSHFLTRDISSMAFSEICLDSLFKYISSDLNYDKQSMVIKPIKNTMLDDTAPRTEYANA